MVAVLAGLALSAYGCGGDDTTQIGDDASTSDSVVPEGGGTDVRDGTTNGDGSMGTDGSKDAPGDGPKDAKPPTDCPKDTPHVDTGSDTGVDSGVDTGVDTGADTGADGGPLVLLDVVQHHNNPSRDGVFVDSAFTQGVAAGVHLDATFGGALTGDVYAQPLFVNHGANAQPAFILAT